MDYHSKYKRLVPTVQKVCTRRTKVLYWQYRGFVLLFLNSLKKGGTLQKGCLPDSMTRNLRS